MNTDNESTDNESIDNESTDDENDRSCPEWAVFEYDRNFLNSKKTNNKYYVGSYDVICTNGTLEPILDVVVSRDAFFKFPFDSIVKYINTFNIQIMEPSHVPEIIKLFIHNNVYIAITKTFWIKIIQRTWKKIMIERNRIMKLRKGLYSLHQYEITGKFPYYLPGILGMLGFQLPISGKHGE